MNIIKIATFTTLTYLATSLGMLADEPLKDLTKGQLNEFIHQYIVDNPEVLVEAMKVLEIRNQQAQVETDKKLVADHLPALENDGFSYIGGNPKGDITLIEFMDYKCAYCKRAHIQVNEIIAADSNVRFIIKELPILGAESTSAAKAAISAKNNIGTDAYKSLSDAMMEFTGPLTKDTIRTLATGLKLDANVIINGMDADSVTAEINKTGELAHAMGISGTPTFVLAGELLRGLYPKEEMLNIIQTARQTNK